jgi:ATP-dependent DNA helicase RecG
MTATPIPRTIALTLYGDLSLSSLKEMPKGRLPITTWIVPPRKREGAYDWTQKEIMKDKAQAFVICPLIEESEKESMQQVRAATNEYKLLKKRFPKLKLGLLHGKMKAEEKNRVLNRFKNKKTDILVATAVVEVGIDVPNATIIIIEASERFGLAQLHQLRGRVGRSDKKSYCMLFTEIRSEKVLTRLGSLEKTMSGFELAELDLKLRGPGEVYGTRQHGFPYLKVADWQKDSEMIEVAREMASKASKNRKKFKKLYEKMKSVETSPN